MEPAQPSYCLDTSAWLDGLKRHYPIETFPTVWDQVESLIQEGRLFWAEEVTFEIRDQDLTDWLARHGSAVIETAVIWSAAQTIQQRFNPDLHEKGILGSDSFVIAAAQVRSLIVVTGEKRSAGRPKIPDVCDQMNIRHLSFLRMLQQEGWRF